MIFIVLSDFKKIKHACVAAIPHLNGGLRSRLRILSKRGKRSKTTILGHIIIAFQTCIPAYGFSAKEDKQQNTLRSRLRILSKRIKTQQNNDSVAHHYGVPSWRSRLGILSKKMINNKKPIRRRKASKTKTRTLLQPHAFFRKKRLWLQNGAPPRYSRQSKQRKQNKKTHRSAATGVLWTKSACGCRTAVFF